MPMTLFVLIKSPHKAALLSDAISKNGANVRIFYDPETLMETVTAHVEQQNSATPPSLPDALLVIEDKVALAGSGGKIMENEFGTETLMQLAEDFAAATLGKSLTIPKCDLAVLEAAHHAMDKEISAYHLVGRARTAPKVKELLQNYIAELANPGYTTTAPSFSR